MIISNLYLVEDNLSDIELVKISLHELQIPIEIVCLRDGQELIESLNGNPDKNDVGLILMDLNMPRMNGHEVLRTLQANLTWRNLPVVIFSTSTNEYDISTSYDLGARAYVCKPTDFMSFHNTIHSIIKFWMNTTVRARA
jgi:two-component system, response regulator